MRLIRSLRRRLAAFAAAREGVTIVEFAIVGPVFFLIVGAILETAIAFFAGQALDTAVSSSTRLIRTGQAQSMSLDQYRNEICGGLYGMFDCDQIRLVVRPLTGFSAFSRTPPVDEDGAWQVADDYRVNCSTNCSAGNTVMVVEAYYKFPSILAIPGLTAGLLPDGTRLLATSRVFMNEPF